MRIKYFLVPALAVLPVYGAELGILLDKQFGKAQAATFSPGQKFDAISPTGMAFRGGIDVLDLKIAALQVNATWHNKTTGDLKVGSAKIGELENQYWAAGAMVNWKLLVNVGAGVEYRSEKLSWHTTTGIPGFPASSGDTTKGRTWARVNLGFSIPTPLVSPFFTLEVAAPLSAKKDSVSVPKDLAQALAPQLQVGIYGGIRF